MSFKPKDKTILFEPGNWYRLTIIKTVSIPHDQDYYVLKDDSGQNYLIPATYYKHYGLYPGKRIMCHLDRINCLGRLFFEPEHPYYQHGKNYYFRFKRCKTNESGYGKLIAIVADRFSREYETIPFHGKIADPPPDEILCKVTRIKKAQLYLQVADPEILKP